MTKDELEKENVVLKARIEELKDELQEANAEAYDLREQLEQYNN